MDSLLQAGYVVLNPESLRQPGGPKSVSATRVLWVGLNGLGCFLRAYSPSA